MNTHPRTLDGPLHQSGARSLEDCPAKFKAECDGLEPNFEPFDRGAVIADIAEATRKECVHDAAAEPSVVAWETFAKLRHRLRSNEAIEETRAIVAGFFLPEFRIDWRVSPIATAKIRLEEPWAMDGDFNAAPDGLGVVFRGRFDVECVEDEIRIEDDKTWAFIPQAVEIATDIQARTYVRAAFARYPKAEFVTFQWNLLRHGFSLAFTFGRDFCWIEGAEISWRAEHEAWLRRRLKERDGFIRSGVWPATPGDGCDSCPLRHACPELQALRAQGARIPEADPVAQAHAYLALKGLLVEYEKAVRKDAANGPTFIGDGKALGFEAKPRRELKAGTEPKLRKDLAMLDASDEELAGWFPPKYTIGSVEKAFKAKAGEAWLDYFGAHVERVKVAQFTTFRPLAGKPEKSK